MEQALKQKLWSALRFAASRSVLSSAEEEAILAIWNRRAPAEAQGDVAVEPVADLIETLLALGDEHGAVSMTYETAGQALRDAAASLTTLSERLADAREVVEPFAEHCDDLFNEWCPDDIPAWYYEYGGFDKPSPVTVGDFRRARAFRDATTSGAQS